MAGLLASHAGQTDADDRAAAVRNGCLPEYEALTDVGSMSGKVPKVRSRTGGSVAFRSSLVLPYVRRARTLEAVPSWLCLKAIASSHPQKEALDVPVRPDAKGMSGSVISRLRVQ